MKMTNVAKKIDSYEKTDEATLAIEKYKKENKEKLLKYPNTTPVFDAKEKKVYCVYRPRTVDDLLGILRSQHRSTVDRILKKYGFEGSRDYVYEKLDLDFPKKKTNGNTDIKALPNLSNVKQMAKFFTIAYTTDADVFVHFLNKETGKSRFYPIDAVKDVTKLSAILNSYMFSGNKDIMYSLSTYKTMTSATEANAFSVDNIQVDIDYLKVKEYKNKSPEEIWQLILQNDVGVTIPYPSAIEYGHQLRLIYAIDGLYIKKGSEAVKTIAKRLSDTFAKRLKQYNAEGQPITSHGRVIGSVNSRDGSIIKMEMFGHIYSVDTLKDKWLDPLPEWYSNWKTKPKPKKKRKIHHLRNEYSLNVARLNDLIKIVRYYNGDLDGRRYICYQVRNHALLAGDSPDEAKKRMLEVNDMFKQSLRVNVIEQDTRNIERKQYFYKSQTILDRLEITPEIEEQLELETLVSEAESKRRNRVSKAAEYRLKTYGDATKTKKMLMKEEQQKIRDLLAAGLSNKEITCELNMSMSTLKRHIRQIKADLID